MKTIVTVIINSDEAPWGTVRALFEACGLSDNARRGPSPIDVYFVSLEATSPALDCLVDRLQAAGLTWTSNRQNVYDEGDLRAAPLLRLLVDRAPKGDGGPRHGTEYDFSLACPSCGSGARHVSPLHLLRSELPKSGPIHTTLTGEILVSERLRAAITAVEPTGLELREAVDAQGGAGVGFFQLLAPSLAPMDATTEGVAREEPCTACGRDGHFDSLRQPMRIVYRRSELPSGLLDAHVTHEWFGNSKLRTPLTETTFAHPLLLVSPRIYDVLNEQRVPRVKFEPVSVV